MERTNGTAPAEKPSALLKRIVKLAEDTRYDLERLERMATQYNVDSLNPIGESIALSVLAQIRGELKMNAIENCALGCEVSPRCA
jgi:hypothetical protein